MGPKLGFESRSWKEKGTGHGNSGSNPYCSNQKRRLSWSCYDFRMPEPTRLEMLQQILAQDPANKLARYGLAMELSNAGETDRAVAEFKKLIENDPAYANAYFMAAQTLQKAERTDEAKEMLAAGIAAAQKAGNGHAESEMQAMLDELEIGY